MKPAVAPPHSAMLWPCGCRSVRPMAQSMSVWSVGWVGLIMSDAVDALTSLLPAIATAHLPMSPAFATIDPAAHSEVCVDGGAAGFGTPSATIVYPFAIAGKAALGLARWVDSMPAVFRMCSLMYSPYVTPLAFSITRPW